MLYYLTILICMIIISIVDVIVAAPIFSFDVWYIILAVVISTVSVIAIDGVCATLSRWIFPKKWFGVDKKFFLAGKKECRFYEKIGIKKWKEKVLELGVFANFRKNKIADPNNNEYIASYIYEANCGILGHALGVIFGYLIIFIYPLPFWLCFGFPVATVNLVLSSMPLMILRYNLPKLHTLYKYNARRERKNMASNSSTDAANISADNTDKNKTTEK